MDGIRNALSEVAITAEDVADYMVVRCGRDNWMLWAAWLLDSNADKLSLAEQHAIQQAMYLPESRVDMLMCPPLQRAH